MCGTAKTGATSLHVSLEFQKDREWGVMENRYLEIDWMRTFQNRGKTLTHRFTKTEMFYLNKEGRIHPPHSTANC